MKNSQLLLERVKTPSIFGIILRDFWLFHCECFDSQEQSCACSRKSVLGN